MLRIPQNWNIGTCLWCLPSNVGPGLIAGSPAVLVQAALDLRAACTRTAELPAIKPLGK